MKTLYTYLFTLTLISSSLAQNAGNWTFNNTLNGAAGSSLTVSAVSLGPAIPNNAFNSGTEWYGEGGWPGGNAINANSYMQFSLTASAAHYLVLNTVKLVQRRSNTGVPMGSGPQSWSIRSSLDNYATDIVTGTQTYDYATYTVTLPAAFQRIATGVTFRIYGYNTTISGSGGISRFVWDNISVQGSSISGVLAEEGITMTANLLRAGTISLQLNATGFSASTDLTIQRSANGTDFTAIHRQQAGSVDGVYRFDDQAAPVSGNVFYRVSASNPDGSSYLSPIVVVRQDALQDTRIRGVIARGGSVQALLQLEAAGAYQLSIWSQDGKALARQVVNSAAGNATAEISIGSMPHGVYILTLSKEGQRSSRQFLY